MATPNMVTSQNRAVVAFLDGRRLKGHIDSFSAQKDHFLFFERDTAQGEGAEVQMKDLKAIFFARDSVGNGEHGASQELNPQNQGRKAEVTFHDGEKLVGSLDAYDPQRIGFFLVPTNPRSKNLRVFVIAENATHIRWI
jgi:small nuclear ribonucleoprotein (snRNP)-like protein